MRRSDRDRTARRVRLARRSTALEALESRSLVTESAGMLLSGLGVSALLAQPARSQSLPAGSAAEVTVVAARRGPAPIALVPESSTGRAQAAGVRTGGGDWLDLRPALVAQAPPARDAKSLLGATTPSARPAIAPLRVAPSSGLGGGTAFGAAQPVGGGVSASATARTPMVSPPPTLADPGPQVGFGTRDGSGGSGGSGGGTPGVHMEIVNNIAIEPGPGVQAVAGTFRVALDSGYVLTSDLSVKIASVASYPDQAQEGVDYVNLPDFVTIPKGKTSVTVEVTPLEDQNIESPYETVTVAIQVEQGSPYVNMGNGSVDLRIYDYSESPGSDTTFPDDNRQDDDSDLNGTCSPPLFVSPQTGLATVAPDGNGQPYCGAPRVIYADETTGAVPEVLTANFTLPANPPSQIVATATVSSQAGAATGGDVYYSTTGFMAGQTVQLAAAVPSNAEATGHYSQTLLLDLGTKTVALTGSGQVVNNSASPYGSGWWIDDLDRIIPGSGGVSLVRGDGTSGWFAADGSGGYTTPLGSTTRLVANPAPGGGWTLYRKQGTALADAGGSVFNAAGQITDRYERGTTTTNGNASRHTKYEYVAGNLSEVTDPDGRIANYSYSGGKLQAMTDYHGRVTTYGYSGTRLISITQADPDGTGPQTSPVTTFSYDSDGLMIQMVDAQNRTTTLGRDATRRIDKVSRPLPANSTAVWNLTPLVTVGLPTGSTSASTPALVMPASAVKATITDEVGLKTDLKTDRFGNVTEEAAPLGRTTLYERDEDGRVTKLTRPGSNMTSFTYDGDDKGNLLQVTLPGGATQHWTYDAKFSVPTQYIDEDGRTTTFVLNATTGDLTAEQAPLGRRTTFTYDGNGRVTSVRRPDPGGATGTQLTSYAYDSRGRLATITWPNLGGSSNDVTTYAYDTQDNLTSETAPLGRVSSYEYDALGRPIAAIAPDPDGSSNADLAAYDPVTGQWRIGQTTLGGTLMTSYPGVATSGGVPQFGGGGDFTPVPADYDGDGKADLGLYKKSSGEWLVMRSSVGSPMSAYPQTGYSSLTNDGFPQFGGPTFTPIPADYDGDGRADLALYNSGTGEWLIKRSGDGSVLGSYPGLTTSAGGFPTTTGTTGYTPVPADYDGDGKADLATYQASTALWRIYLSGSDGALLTSYSGASVQSVPGTGLQFGGTDFKPVPADYDGDGKADLALFRSVMGQSAEWLIVRSSDGGVYVPSYFGIGPESGGTFPHIMGTNSQSIPLPADFDGGGLHAMRSTSSYRADGSLERTTDPLGRTVTYGYDPAGRVQSVTTPDAGAGAPVTTYTYDSGGRLSTVVEPLTNAATTRTTTYTYDGASRLQAVTEPVAGTVVRVTAYSYDVLDRLTTLTLPVTTTSTRTISYGYDGRDRLTSVSRPAPGGGNQAVTYSYDGAGHLTVVKAPLNRTTTYAYDGAGRLQSLTEPNPGSLSPVTTYTYDAADRLTKMTDPLSRVTTYNYDTRGRLTKLTDPLVHATTYAYDAADRLTQMTDPLSRVTTYNYDALDRVIAVVRPPAATGVAATTIRTLFDRANRPFATIDPLGHTTTQNYDARDRLRSVVTEDPDGLGSTNIRKPARTTYTYDLADRLTNVTDPVNNVTAYAYDVLDRTTTVTDPLGKVTTYGYNLADELTSRTDRLGRTTNYGYDILGRMTAETWAGTGGRTITYSYDLANRVTTIADPDATLSSGYDALDRMTTATTSGAGSGQPNLTLTSGYDKVGNRTKLTDSLSGSGTSGQGVTTYSYDLADRLTTIMRSYGGTAGPQVVLAYDNADRLTTIARTLGTTGTAVRTLYGYDGLDRLTAIDHAQVVGTTVTPRDAYAYGYDAADRLSTESSSFGGLTKAITYAYDASNQLVAADRDGAATTADESYSYDANGNREMTGYATTTGNRIGSSPGFTYAYDFEGNLKSKTETASGRVTTYGYDHRNRLTGATTKAGTTITAQATFTYDAADRRIRTQLDADGTGGAAPVTTWTVYDGQNPYADFSGGGALQTRYLHGPAVDWLLARTAAGGATAWYLTDRLGSVRDLVGSAGPTAGTVLDHIDYDAYGRVTSESSPANGDRFKFTGRELDNVTGLQYNRARYYDAAIGRWTQEDPIGFAGGDSNLHRYVGNAPTNSTDPSGLAGDEPWVYFDFGDFAHTLFVDEIYGGAEALVTGKAGRALGERAVKITENRTGRDFDGGFGDFCDFSNAVAGDLVGTSGVVEGTYGYDLATMDELNGTDRVVRIAGGTSRLAGAGTGVLYLSGKVPTLLPTFARGAGVTSETIAQAAAQAAIRQRVLANIAKSKAATGTSRFVPRTPGPGINVPAMLESANQPLRGGLTVAGRALSKHPNVVGMRPPAARVTEALTARFGGNSGINAATAEALNNIIRNGRCTLKLTKSHGQVFDFKLPNGIGARFSATTNKFITFLGRGK